LLQPVERQLFVHPPVPFGIVLGKVEEWLGVFREVLDETLVEIGET
jgi:hypothetical protein